MSNPPPRRRRTDRLPDKVYRDIWLLIITATVVFAVFAARSENRHRIDDIQASRAESIRLTCEQQNERHDRALAALDSIVARRLGDASPVERRRLQASRATTATLIVALVPREDCERRVRRLVEPVE